MPKLNLKKQLISVELVEIFLHLVIGGITIGNPNQDKIIENAIKHFREFYKTFKDRI